MSHRAKVLGASVIVLGAACGEPPTDPGLPIDSGPSVASVTIEPGSIHFGALASVAPLAATVRSTTGAVLSDVPVTWGLEGFGVVTVTTDGVLRSVANGTDTVTATAGDVTGRAPVRVAQVVARLAIGEFSNPVRVVGDTVFLVATPADSNGRAVTGASPGAVTWGSSDAAVAAVDVPGLMISAGVGNASVTATMGAFADTTVVTVAPLGPDGSAILGETVPCAGALAGPFPCNRMEILAYLPKGGFGGRDAIGINDLWGWTDPVTGEEWALVGRTDGTAFVNVTDPRHPVYAGVLPRTNGSPVSSWRDLKVYGDHVFIVADGAGQHGVQVFDLRTLRGYSGPPRALAETARYTGVASVHNIAINEATGFAYVVGSNGGGQTCGSGLHMIDIRTPSAPEFAGCFNDPQTGYTPGYTHDVQCVVYGGPDPDHQGGREICFGLNENALSIADVTDKSAPVAVSRASYPNVRYAHQGWLSDDHRYFYSDDEQDEFAGVVVASRTVVWDVTDLDDPVPIRDHLGPTRATDHNLYVRGNRLYASNYQFGIRVLDLTDPAAPAELGYFDTAPSQPDAPGFGGSWSNYPFFQSGIVVVTSWDEGLFVLRVN